MSKHTPGPWWMKPLKYRENGEVKYFPSVVLAPDVKGLRYSDGSGTDEGAERSASLVVNVGLDPNDLKRNVMANRMATCIANAALIAAAPELAEALRALLVLIDHVKPYGKDEQGVENECLECGSRMSPGQYQHDPTCRVEAARAALKKAGVE